MENQINVGNQNTQQIGQNPVDQHLQVSGKPKINYLMIPTIILAAVIAILLLGYSYKNFKSHLWLPPMLPSCTPEYAPKLVEIYFSSNDPYFSLEGAKKIVQKFSSPISILETVPEGMSEYIFDLKEEIIPPEQPLLSLWAYKLSGISQIKEASRVSEKNQTSETKLFIEFNEAINADYAQRLVRSVYPKATIVSLDNDLLKEASVLPQTKEKAFYFDLKEKLSEDDPLYTFLLNKFSEVPGVKHIDYWYKDTFSRNTILVEFNKQITPGQARDSIRRIYPKAILLDVDGNQREWFSVYLKVETIEGKEWDLIDFLRKEEYFNRAERVYIKACPIP